MTMCLPPVRLASGCVLLLSALLAATPASGQTQNSTINMDDPTLREAMPSCVKVKENIEYWDWRFEAWAMPPGREIIVELASDEPMTSIGFKDGSYVWLTDAPSNDWSAHHDSEVRFFVILSRLPDQYYFNTYDADTDEQIQLRRFPASRVAAYAASDCGSPTTRATTTSTRRRSSRPTGSWQTTRSQYNIPMNTGMGYDMLIGIGSVDYSGMENPATKADFTGAAYYQVGLNSMLAGVLRGELSLDLGASDMEAEDPSDLEEVDGFAARAFAEINVNDILSVGYGVMGASLSGSSVGGTEYGGDGFLLSDAVRGTLSIITDGPGLRVAAYRTLNAATAFQDDEQHYDEQLYRFGATWGSQGDFELGYEIRDVEYVADAGRDISGLTNSIYLQMYLRP